MERILEKVTWHVQSKPSGDGAVDMLYDVMDKSGSFGESCRSCVRVLLSLRLPLQAQREGKGVEHSVQSPLAPAASSSPPWPQDCGNAWEKEALPTLSSCQSSSTSSSYSLNTTVSIFFSFHN